MAIGFSHHTALPAAAARCTRSAWTVERGGDRDRFDALIGEGGVDVGGGVGAERSGEPIGGFTERVGDDDQLGVRHVAGQGGGVVGADATGADEREPDRALSLGGHAFSLN